jgi:hypothetical protein
MHVIVDDRKIRSNREYAMPGDEVNGSDALDGDYSSGVDLLALEIRKTF